MFGGSFRSLTCESRFTKSATVNSESGPARPAGERSSVPRMLDDVDSRSRGAIEGSSASWREPIEHYRSPARLSVELQMMRRYPTPFCPSAALPEVGSYVAREAAGTPLIAVRGADGRVCVLRNVSRARGALAARGAGGAPAFACRSHGWALGLDGRLRHASDDGVSCLDQASPGLTPVHAVEHGGLVFVTQDLPSLAESSVDELVAIIPPGERFYSITEDDVAANWKILAEGFIAGYHIRTTHRDTVYPSVPSALDNRSIAEESGANRPVAFSCQARAKRRAASESDRVLTYAYHLFPNVMMVMLPDLLAMIALEPVATDRTRVVTYALSAHGDREASPPEVAHAKVFLDAGVAEDRVIASTVQRRLANGGNTHVEFGRGEGALAQFHRRLHAMLARP